MGLKSTLDDIAPQILKELSACEQCTASIPTREGLSLSGQQAVQDVLAGLIALLFPGCHMRHKVSATEFSDYFPLELEKTALTLRDLCREAFEYDCARESCETPDCSVCDEKAVEAVTALVRELPDILRTLQTDIQAAYEGDPAARSSMEVVMSYPGVFAIIVHRIAHCLYTLSVPLIPRVMTEYAHSKTGIDIHPGATIGDGFFIDHGTGVVVGETCTIGAHVKLYQGVTLGALSFEKDADGRLVKGIKRHPDVGDYVVIYAGATILGGKTRIGDKAVIGGNVWLTHSVPPGAKVYNQQPKPLIREADGGWRTADGPWNDVGGGI